MTHSSIRDSNSLNSSVFGYWTEHCDSCLTLSLPEWIIEFCKVALTFESVDEILWCDHSNETSRSVLSHGATCVSKFYKTNFGIFYRILPMATFGREGVNRLDHRIKTSRQFFLGTLHSRHAAPLHLQSSWNDSMGSKHLRSIETVGDSFNRGPRSFVGTRSTATFPGSVRFRSHYTG